ncbi:MAG: ceramide glucosyltransferase [Pseudobdellovibrionaceae bacterium]
MGAYLAFCLWATVLFFIVWGTRLTLRQLTKKPPFLDAPFALSPVSILKPMKGLDPEYKTNLQSVFELDYPSYEILFSVADPADPIIPHLQHMQARYPKIHSRIFIGETEIGPNPKINNLVQIYNAAQYDWLFINDSNTFLQTSELRRMMGYVDSSTGVITSLVAGKNAHGLGGNLESLTLNSHVSRGMCLAFALGTPIVLGKAMLFRKSMANRFGGMETLARYLNEDYMTGEGMRMLGLKIILAGDPIAQPIGRISLKAYWQRQLRWGRIRKAQLRVKYLIEFLSQPFVSFLFLLPFFDNFGVGLGLSAIHWLTWWFCDWKLQSKIGSSMTPLNHFSFWILRELLQIPLWWHSACGNTVYWRGRKLRVLPGGTLESAG